MIINKNIKLIPIFNRNFDKTTDQLYDPLRHALNTNTIKTNIPGTPKLNFHLDQATGYPVSSLRNSYLHTTTLRQQNIKNSILIPVNKKLSATNNSNTITRAKSRTFRTLSVQNKIGTPIRQDLFRTHRHNNPSFREIVYDYEQSNTNSIKSSYAPPPNQNIPPPPPPQYIQKSRSMTCITPTYHSIDNHLENNIENNIYNIKDSRKEGIKKRGIQCSKGEPIKEDKGRAVKEGREDKGGQDREDLVRQDYYMCQYYQGSKKYRFNKDSIKTKSKQYESKYSNKSNDYKYNLFNVLDEQVNERCSTGLCNKNQLIASKLKHNW